MPLEERAGHATFWRSFGHGERPALAIHCGLASSAAWEGVAGHLADRLTLKAFDLPGHGRSGDWPGEGDGLMQAVQIAASFVEEPVDLIGHSFGAVVALRLAIAAPDAFRTLTLVEPVLFAAAKDDPEWEEHRAEMADFDRFMAEGNREAATAAFTRVWGVGADWEKMNEERRRDVADRIHLIVASHPALFEDSGGILKPDALESLDMPVLLIRGEASPSIIERIAENIAARLPDVGIATVPRAGHMVPITHPAEVAGLIGVNLDRG